MGETKRWEWSGWDGVFYAGHDVESLGEEAMAEYVNALEAEVVALKTRAALADEIVADVRRWVENLDYEYEAEAWLARYDALAGKGGKETRDG